MWINDHGYQQVIHKLWILKMIIIKFKHNNLHNLTF